MIRTIFFIGKPGSGKETQAHLLADKLGYTVLSTGEKFRELRQRQDALGEHIRSEYDAGKLMPDWFADFLLQEAVLQLSSEAGIIFEGSARTIEQAERIDNILSWLGREYVFINLDISDEEALKRMLGRARHDSDSEEKIRRRLSTYAENSAPVIEYQKEAGRLININGERSIEEVHEDIVRELSA